jgi:two-component system OmpR family response regulator
MPEVHPTPRILIVEDHLITAELVETWLRIEGMYPVKSNSAREALALLAKQSFDAVVLDIMMPDVDGYEVLRQIRSTPETVALPVILLTAKPTPADVEKGMLMGANHYMTKPFSGHDLVTKIRSCLEPRFQPPAP